MIFQKQKKPFQAIKKNKSKTVEKLTFFQTHRFCPKMTVFPTFFFQPIQARKMSFMVFQNEKTPFKAIKRRSSKSRKIDIFQKGLTHGFGPKLAIFSTSFFLAIQAKKMSLTKFLNEKTRFQTIKRRSSKSREIDVFSKGLTYGFRPKMAISPIFLYQGKQPRKTSFMIFQTQTTPVQAIKTRTSQSRKRTFLQRG